MGVNIFFNPATVVTPTGTARQWTVGPVTVIRDGVTVINAQSVTFPDVLQTWVSGGFITAEDVNKLLVDLLLKAARKRYGIDTGVD